jgi:DNA-binding MurR/RpiR family transcriptional regulator
MFCGVGNGAIVSQEAYNRWRRIGFPALHAIDPDIQLILASQLRQGDVLVAISHSGQTKTLLSVVKEATKGGATVVAITNFPFSALAKRATFVLQTAVFSSYISGEIMSKRIAELCVIESLFVNFLMRQQEKYVAQLKAANEALKINKL